MNNLPTRGSPVVGGPISTPAPRYWIAVLATVLWMAPGIAAASLADLKFVSKSGEFLSKCNPDKPAETRFTVQGPGVLHVKLNLEPYRSGIWTLHIPVSWTLYKADGSHTGWGQFPYLGHYENGGFPAKTTQAGKPVKGGKYIDGLPLESESWALVSKNKYVIGVRLGGTCAKQGHTWTQWGQVNRLTVSFAPGATKPTSSTAGTGQPGAGGAGTATATPAPGSSTGTGKTSGSGTAAPSSKPGKDKEKTGNAGAKPSKTVFDNGNAATVHNRPTQPTVFSLSKPTRITLIQNYHWNNAKGAPPGTISLKNDKGKTVGSWPATGKKGQGGVPNAYWICKPGIVLAPGRYTVGDSDPATWAQNSGSGGTGMTHIEGYVE